jgi:hypothetical protein
VGLYLTPLGPPARVSPLVGKGGSLRNGDLVDLIVSLPMTSPKRCCVGLTSGGPSFSPEQNQWEVPDDPGRVCCTPG